MAVKEQKQVTIGELQTFIEAVEFTADLPDDQEWAPSARQWKKIRQMIDNLHEKPVVQERIEQPVYYNNPTSGFTNPSPATPSSLPSMNMAPPTLPPGAPFATNEGIPVKTPNIDTTNGSYKSSFA